MCAPRVIGQLVKNSAVERAIAIISLTAAAPRARGRGSEIGKSANKFVMAAVNISAAAPADTARGF